MTDATDAGTAAVGGAGTLARRVVRSSAITVGGFAATQAIRLASNLILTRLLFPEAFGLMALVGVFLAGLAMLSDVGTGPAIMQSRRGDEPDFLDTAWTVQIVRGALLFAAAAALSPLVARLYGEPALASMLPVAAGTLLIAGFNPTRLETQNRHLRAGRLTIIEIVTQGWGVAVAVTLAWMTGSVWSLVASGLAAQALNLLLLNLWLPGHRNRPRWEPAAARELVRFGRWIFLSTLAGFAVWQADKLILGHALPLAEFGLYNIAFFLASVPATLGQVVTRRVLIPVYRDSPPAASAANRARVRRLRAGALGALLLLTLPLSFGGAWLVGLLYDPRYQAAGGVAVLVAALQAPVLLFLTCDQAALAAGDSRRFFWLTLARAALGTGGLLAGLALGGLGGAVGGQAAGTLAAYPVLAWLLRPHGAWDPALDAAFLALAAALGAGALWLNAGALAAMP